MDTDFNEDGAPALTSRRQVKKALLTDPHLQRKMKKTLLAMWDDGLVNIFSDSSVSLTEKARKIAEAIERTGGYSTGYSPDVLAFFKHALTSMRKKGE